MCVDKPSIRDGFILLIHKKGHSFECQHSIALAYRIGVCFSSTL